MIRNLNPDILLSDLIQSNFLPRFLLPSNFNLKTKTPKDVSLTPSPTQNDKSEGKSPAGGIEEYIN